jgi:hypothetical protein
MHVNEDLVGWRCADCITPSALHLVVGRQCTQDPRLCRFRLAACARQSSSRWVNWGRYVLDAPISCQLILWNELLARTVSLFALHRAVSFAREKGDLRLRLTIFGSPAQLLHCGSLNGWYPCWWEQVDDHRFRPHETSFEWISAFVFFFCFPLQYCTYLSKIINNSAKRAKSNKKYK